MIFRPIELALDPKDQFGFMLGSFSFVDGTFYGLLGAVYDHNLKVLYASCCFFSWIFEFTEVEIDEEGNEIVKDNTDE